MTDSEGLNVYLVDFETGLPLPVFDTVKTISKTSSRQRRWAVEAIADQRFAIEVTVEADFDWVGCNALEVKLGFDVGEQVNCRSIYLLKDNMRMKELDLPRLTYNGGLHSYCIDHILVEDPEHENVGALRSHFYFRQLRDDDAVRARGGLPQTFDNQGKIRVEVARVVISVRNRVKGLQTDTGPSYRRQAKTRLLQKGITLEVLLRTDSEKKKTQFKGNFKSDRPQFSNQQVNFDFIYREAGHHDTYVDPADIVEVRNTPKHGSSVREEASKRSTPATRDDSLARPSRSSIARATGRANFPATTIKQRNTVKTRSSLRSSSCPPSLTQSQTFIPQNFPFTFNYPIPKSAAEMSGNQANSSAARQPAPVQPAEEAPAQGADNNADNANNGADPVIINPDLALVIDLLNAQDERRVAEANEMQAVRNQITDIEQRHQICRDNIENLRGELRNNYELSSVLESTRRVLEIYYDELGALGQGLDARQQQALDNFRDAMIEIYNESAEKRRRNEEARNNGPGH